MTDWAAAAVGLAGVGAALASPGDPGLLGMAPILASVVAWSAHRVRWISVAGLVLVMGCVAGPVVGAFTTVAEQSVVVELMWLVVGVLLGAFVLPLRLYAGVVVAVVLLEAVGTVQNPEIPLLSSLNVTGFLTVLAVLVGLGLREVEQHDARALERQRALERALLEAQQRALDLEQMKVSLRETRSQLVHVGRLATLGEVAAEVAHELNNPLTTVLMSAEALRDELQATDPELAGVADDVLTAARVCAGVTNRVLWFGRQRGPEVASVSVSTVVAHAVAITRAPLRKARCTVSVDIEQDAVIMGDVIQLTQVFVNLLVNAGTVMPRGGQVWVRVGLDDRIAWATVQDDGPGVALEVADRIFEPFFSTRTADGGSGLGLAISRAVIETHGGRLVLETRAPQPARFRVELPDGVAVDAPSASGVDAPGPRPARRGLP